jgi:hypothetical protein
LLKIDPKNLMKELETTETFIVEKVLDKEVLVGNVGKRMAVRTGCTTLARVQQKLTQDNFK